MLQTHIQPDGQTYERGHSYNPLPRRFAVGDSYTSNHSAIISYPHQVCACFTRSLFYSLNLHTCITND